MKPEAKFVVNPLEKYFLDINRSGAKWRTKDKPRFESSATGWDLQMERKNQVLLFEAKYIRGPFASALAGTENLYMEGVMSDAGSMGDFPIMGNFVVVYDR